MKFIELLKRKVPIILTIFCCAIVLWLSNTHVAHAIGLFSYDSLSDFLLQLLAELVHAVLLLVSNLVTFSGWILNISIILTLHIRDFVQTIPAVYSVWQTIRDITGLLFIFFLLYAAFNMILGNDGYGNLLKNIVVAGILVNFSFFITGVAIDASNVVSLAIYNAMLPNSPTITIDANTKMEAIAKTLTQNPEKGGLSDVFMQSLKLQSIFDTRTGADKVIKDPFRIIVVGIVGIMIMVTASLSFMAAAGAFIVRLVILIFLLAFSSIYFPALVIPQLKPWTKKFTDQLYSQLIFMPVYLLLTYVSLRILLSSNLIGAGVGFNAFGNGAADWISGFIMLGINFVLVIFMLNLPLVVAVSLGGSATGWIGKTKFGQLAQKWNSGAIWKQAGAGTYTGTVRRGASWLARSEGLKDLASKSRIVSAGLKGVRGVASDYDKKLSEQVKSRTDFAESLGYRRKEAHELEEQLRLLQQRIASGKAAGLPPIANAKAQVAALKAQIEQVKSERQSSYAGTIDQRTYETLWTKVARKNKVAAAKIQTSVYKKQLEKRQKSLDEKRGDIKSKQKDIDQLQKRIAAGTAGPTAAAALATMQTELRALHGDEAFLLSNPGHGGNVATMGVNDIESALDEFESIT